MVPSAEVSLLSNPLMAEEFAVMSVSAESTSPCKVVRSFSKAVTSLDMLEIVVP